MTDYSPDEKKVLTHLQRGVEPVSHPFAEFDLPEEEVIDLLQRVKENGLLRRFGGVFDARRLGYTSILCALDVPEELLDEKAAVVSALPGVTHCYERKPFRGNGHFPQLWFTLAILESRYEEELAVLREQLAPGLLYELPALMRFKIDVVFDLHRLERGESLPGRVSSVSHEESFRAYSQKEQALVRAVDQQIPLVVQPFAEIARQIGQAEAWVLSTLQTWKGQGVLRRIGAILYHRKAGFSANAMCVWPVASGMDEAGRRVAARPEVTHCYQRPRLEAFPFDLYAMIHAGSWGKIDTLFKSISSSCELDGGELFVSGKEFKKSSMKYFR